MLSTLCCLVIVAIAVLVGARLVSAHRGFKTIMSNFENGTIVEKSMKRTSNTQEWNLDEGVEYKKSRSTQEDERYHIEALSVNKEEFYKQYAKYVSTSQMIALFPLLGILGTVGGLAFSGRFGNVEQMLSGLSMALWTTIFGLIASIILKAYDAKGPGKMVNELDAKFSIFEETIHMQTLIKELRSARNEILDHTVD